MLKLSDLVEACRDVAHFCSEIPSVFKQAFNRAGSFVSDVAATVSQNVAPVVTPDLRI